MPQWTTCTGVAVAAVTREEAAIELGDRDHEARVAEQARRERLVDVDVVGVRGEAVRDAGEPPGRHAASAG